MKSICIKKINTEEIDNVMKIWLDSNIEVHNFVDKSHWINIYEGVKNKLINSECTYGYYDNNTLKAFINIEKDGYINELYTDKIYRSNGIGAELIEYFKPKNKELSLHVFKKNERAVKFYEKEGFQIVREEIEEETNEIGYFMKYIKVYKATNST